MDGIDLMQLAPHPLCQLYLPRRAVSTGDPFVRQLAPPGCEAVVEAQELHAYARSHITTSAQKL